MSLACINALRDNPQPHCHCHSCRTAMARFRPAERPIVPLDLGGAVIGLQEQPDGSVRILP